MVVLSSNVSYTDKLIQISLSLILLGGIFAFQYSFAHMKSSSLFFIPSQKQQPYDREPVDDKSSTNFEEKTIAICYFVTYSRFYEVMVSIFSIYQTKTNPFQYNVYIYVLDAKEFPSDLKETYKKVKSIGNNISVNLIHLNNSYIRQRFNFQIIKIKPVVMCRLLLPELVKEDITIHLDSEVVGGLDFFNSLRQQLSFSRKIIFGVEDLGIQRYKWLRDALRKQKMASDFYINAGIFIIKNGPKARELFESAIEFANSQRLCLADQDALNNLGPKYIGLLPYVFNCRTGLVHERDHCLFHHDTALPTNRLWRQVEKEFREYLQKTD